MRIDGFIELGLSTKTFRSWRRDALFTDELLISMLLYSLKSGSTLVCGMIANSDIEFL